MSAKVTELPRAGRHVEGPDIAEVKAAQSRAVRRSRRFVAAGISVSVMWLFVCGIYVNDTLGWDLAAS